MFPPGHWLAAEEENYGSTILFYPRDGGTPHIFQMGERTGETVRLPMGTYDAIIFNRSFNDFSNIAFRGDSYETLEAYARKVETRVDEVTRVETRTIISSPDELAVATLEGFIVTEDMLGNYSQTTYGRTAASRTAEEETDFGIDDIAGREQLAHGQFERGGDQCQSAEGRISSSMLNIA